MSRDESLRQLQSYSFAAYDMLLYLDTHPNDKKAFEMFKELVGKTKMLMAEHEKEFGPLTAFGAAAFEQFEWIKSPWPWEKEGN